MMGLRRFVLAGGTAGVFVLAMVVAANAQTSLPGQLSNVQNFICTLVAWLQGLAPFILMLALVAGLFMALVAKKGSLVGDLIAAVIIALILINLGPIMGALQLTHC